MVIKSDNAKDKALAPKTPIVLLNVIPIAMILITTMCPAEMLANRRTISANGLVKVPKNSIGA